MREVISIAHINHNALPAFMLGVCILTIVLAAFSPCPQDGESK